jgi:hypothetical protein
VLKPLHTLVSNSVVVQMSRHVVDCVINTQGSVVTSYICKKRATTQATLHLKSVYRWIKRLSFLQKTRLPIIPLGSVADQPKKEMNQSTTYWRTRPSLDLQENPSHSKGIRGSTTIVPSSQHTKYDKASIATGQPALKISSSSSSLYFTWLEHS